MKHEPFPIANFEAGLSLAKEPWISPLNTFRQLDNGRVFRGRLQKRSGFSLFAELASGSADLTRVTEYSVGPTYYYFMPNPATEWPVYRSLSFRFDTTGGSGPPYINAESQASNYRWVEVDDLTGGWNSAGEYANTYTAPIFETGTTNQIGVVQYCADPTTSPNLPPISAGPNTGVVPVFQALVRWDLHSAYVSPAANGGEILYRLNPLTPVIGLTNFQEGNNAYDLAADPDYLYEYNASAGYYEEQGGVAFDSPRSFSGGNSDYFWFWPFDDYVLLTNGVDPVCRWDPTAATAVSISEQPTNFDGSPGNDITTALMVIRLGGRAVYLKTTEGATIHPTRARFSAPGAYDTFDAATDFTDAPRELGDIVTCQFIGELCYVGFERGWMELRVTGDATQPLKWVPAISRFGSVSKLSTIQDNERLLSRSDTTMQAIDPNGQYYLDADIPDLVLGFSPANTEKSAATRNESQRAFWWSYVGVNKTTPQDVLVATYDEERRIAWSQYGMRFNVFGEINSAQSPTWNSLGPLTWNDYSGVSWNDIRIGAEGFTQTIGGGNRGDVYAFDLSSRDYYLAGAEAIDFVFKTQALAPYPGQKAHLKWIDFYFSASSMGSLDVKLFADNQSTHYTSFSVSRAPNQSSGVVYRRVAVGRTAAFHSLQGTSSDNNALSIDAMILWFRPAGRIKVFN